MQWFRNMKALYRLMASFGLMLLLMLGVGYMALSSLDDSNTRMNSLYNDDMLGLHLADSMVVDRFMLGRDDRDAIVNIDRPDILATDEKAILSDMEDLNNLVAQADKAFSTKEGRANIARIRAALPTYEKAHLLLIDRLNAQDVDDSRQATNQILASGKPFYEAAETLRTQKLALGEQKSLVSFFKLVEVDEDELDCDIPERSKAPVRKTPRKHGSHITRLAL